MAIAHIDIIGEIGWMQTKDASDYGEVNLKDVKNQYSAQSDCEEIMVHIHSPGGVVTEGFAIHDYLRSLGKPITTSIEGMCYSIATVIALAGDKRVMTSNSDFMIHNPWSMAAGESSDFQKQADNLKSLETKASKFYAEKTKITEDQALNFMKEETFMDAEKALELGFITEIKTVMKAVAKFNPKNEKMAKEPLTKEEASGLFAKMQESFEKLLGKNKPVMKVVQDANGVEIDFPDVAEDADVEVGNRATVEGSPADGSYTLPDGTVYTFESGELTAMEMEEEDESEEVQALKEEIEQLKAEKAEAETNAQALKNGLEEMKSNFEQIKSSFSTEKKDGTKKEQSKKRTI